VNSAGQPLSAAQQKSLVQSIHNEIEAYELNNQDETLVLELYRFLMIGAACMVCLAHGSNDVANSISPLIIVLEVEDINERFAFVIGASGIALGLITLGYKVMETVGKKVIKLDFAKGFAAQFASAMAVISGSILSLPLSTTHCAVGALFGIACANHTPCVKGAYVKLDDIRASQVETPQELEGIEKKEDSKTNTKVIAKILVFWALTVPCAMGISALATTIVI